MGKLYCKYSFSLNYIKVVKGYGTPHSVLMHP